MDAVLTRAQQVASTPAHSLPACSFRWPPIVPRVGDLGPPEGRDEDAEGGPGLRSLGAGGPHLSENGAEEDSQTPGRRGSGRGTLAVLGEGPGRGRGAAAPRKEPRTPQHAVPAAAASDPEVSAPPPCSPPTPRAAGPGGRGAGRRGARGEAGPRRPFSAARAPSSSPRPGPLFPLGRRDAAPGPGGGRGPRPGRLGGGPGGRARGAGDRGRDRAPPGAGAGGGGEEEGEGGGGRGSRAGSEARGGQAGGRAGEGAGGGEPPAPRRRSLAPTCCLGRAARRPPPEEPPPLRASLPGAGPLPPSVRAAARGRRGRRRGARGQSVPRSGSGPGGGRCPRGPRRSMWRARWDPGVLKAEALALLPCGLGMAFSQSHVMAARRHQHSRLIVEVDEYSSNPTQAFTFYNINQGRFQPPHVQMVDPVPHDAPKPPGYTRFVCVSDTHSRTDPIQMPYGDVLIHAGDFTELGLPSEVKKFNEWLGSLPYEYKIVIAGNHELTFDQEFMADLIKQDFYYFPSVSKLKPENYENVQSLLTNCIYLQDSEVAVRGFRVYGSPWQPWFYGWGFNLPRGQALLEKWNLIPEGVDVLITHGPPLGFLDWVPKKMQRVGCVELLNTVQRRVQPRLHVFGHIHEGYGVMADGTTTYVNASVCTVNYQPVNPPIVIDLPTPRNS
ncbi:hypothetical protein AB1E19_004570 [Capra hircus]